MKTLRWTWPALVVVLLLLLPWIVYQFRRDRPLGIVVVDKTVPFQTRVEHRSLFWLLNYLKVVRLDGQAFDLNRDYLGAFPGPKPGDLPVRTSELTSEIARGAELLYLADTYGVYTDDLMSMEQMKAALERSRKIYGGLSLPEAEAARIAFESGRTVVAEFNTMGSPTPVESRRILEAIVGVHWSRWIGRFFPRLEDREEVPEWMRKDYEREWMRRWEFSGPGFVLMQDDAHCEVLRVGVEAERVGVTIQRSRPVAPVLQDAVDGTPYEYWFDIVEARPGTQTLATFNWHLTELGYQRLRFRGLPDNFPAVTVRTGERGGTAYYFGGDFADNPMPDRQVPFAGYLAFRRTLEAKRYATSKPVFYWCFYVPMMTRLLDGLPPRTTTAALGGAAGAASR